MLNRSGREALGWGPVTEGDGVAQARCSEQRTSPRIPQERRRPNPRLSGAATGLTDPTQTARSCIVPGERNLGSHCRVRRRRLISVEQASWTTPSISGCGWFSDAPLTCAGWDEWCSFMCCSLIEKRDIMENIYFVARLLYSASVSQQHTPGARPTAISQTAARASRLGYGENCG
jgi:hypothetical protein